MDNLAWLAWDHQKHEILLLTNSATVVSCIEWELGLDNEVSRWLNEASE